MRPDVKRTAIGQPDSEDPMLVQFVDLLVDILLAPANPSAFEGGDALAVPHSLLPEDEPMGEEAGTPGAR